MRNGCRGVLAVLGMSLGLAPAAGAVTWEVSAGALCPGVGSLASPFCTIGLGAAAAVAGDIVNVAPGVYREQVTPPVSGVTYGASGPGAQVLGTDNLSGPGLWTLEPASTTRFSTPFDPDTATTQVFVDDQPLLRVTTLGAVVANSFFFDNPNNKLVVDLGGDNPGDHIVEAGARPYGFNVEGRTDVTVEGFETRGQNNSGIRVRSSSNVVIRGNRVLRADDFALLVEGTITPVITTTGPVEVSDNEVLDNNIAGIRLRNNVMLATVRNNISHHNRDHGLLVGGTTASEFSGNTFFANSKPAGQFTTGMRIDGNSDGNLIERNLSFENQDSGFQVSGGADANLLVRNISFANGDHGFDVRECDSPRLISNTAWGNTNDGFSLEGGSAPNSGVTNATLVNNIATENGVTTNEFNLFVRDDSTVGFVSDYNVFWNAGAAVPIEFDGVPYASIAAFNAATGNEAHGVGGDPLFADTANGDFHPGIGAATDNADASTAGFQAADFDGMPPLDLPSVANTGAGVPDFADRGALEYREGGPEAKLTVSPKKARPGDVVQADGSRSSDDVGIASYRFDWGDGTSTTQAGPVATHSFTEKGKYHVRLTVTDGAGFSATQQKLVQVRCPKKGQAAERRRRK